MSCDQKNGYFKTKNGKIYGPYHYDRPVHHFSPKDIARIIDKVRTQGKYDDYTIARAITDAYGVTNFICAITKLFAFMQSIGFITAVLIFLKAIRTLLKAIKLLKISPLAKTIEYAISWFRFTLEYSDVVMWAKFLIFLSVIDSFIALAILYVDLGIGALEVFNDTNLICEAMSVVSSWQPVAKSFINLNDDWYGIIEQIKAEHNNLKQYDEDINNLNGDLSSFFPDA